MLDKIDVQVRIMLRGQLNTIRFYSKRQIPFVDRHLTELDGMLIALVYADIISFEKSDFIRRLAECIKDRHEHSRKYINFKRKRRNK